VAFWSLNIGLAAMVVLSLLPIGLAQTWASIEHGMWYARSADFMQQPFMQTLRWLRVVGDVIFSIGVMALAWFVFTLRPGRPPARPPVEELPHRAPVRTRELEAAVS